MDHLDQIDREIDEIWTFDKDLCEVPVIEFHEDRISADLARDIIDMETDEAGESVINIPNTVLPS